MAIANRYAGRCVCGAWVAKDAGFVLPSLTIRGPMQVYCPADYEAYRPRQPGEPPRPPPPPPAPKASPAPWPLPRTGRSKT